MLEDDYVHGVDFLPDSTRLVTTSDNKTANVWDVTTGEKVLTLLLENDVRAAKYSPLGDRIMTATQKFV